MIATRNEAFQLPQAVEEQHRFSLLLLSRMVVVTALLLSTMFFSFRAGLSTVASTQRLLYGVAILSFALSAGYWLWLRRPRARLNNHIQLNLVVDVVVATVLVFVTGSVESPFTFFYAMPIITTAAFYSHRGTLMTATLCCVCLAALLVLERYGYLPRELDEVLKEMPEPRRVVYLLVQNFTVFFVIAWLAGYLGDQLRLAGNQLRRTEGDLERLASLNRDIVYSLRSGLLVVNDQGQVTLVNPVAEELIGKPSAQWVGARAGELFPPLLPLLPALTQNGDSLHTRAEVSYLRPSDGRSIPIGLTLSSLRGVEGEAGGILVHLLDLTERKALQASMQRSEKMAALGAMAAGMAHEIRNPLAAISGSVQMLRSLPALTEQPRRLMEIILRETQRLDTLLADFLAFARPKEPCPRKCSLAEIVEETVAVFQHREERLKPELRCSLADVTGQVDPDQMRQVLWNLLSNAVQATDEHGHVWVTLSEDRDEAGAPWALLEVVDDGPGIPPELRERVFEPFFTTRERGSGLGLAMVSRIVESHGGSIGIRTPSEGGNAFVIRLPGVAHE